MVPTPYGVRWTAKLIRRDLKGIATDCTNKVRSFFSHTTDTAVAISHDQIEVGFPVDAAHPHDVAPVSPEPSATSITTTDSELEAPREATNSSLYDPTTLYGLLSTKLKELYASRQRDLPLNERWLFRGAWLILHMATQYCASNPNHDILKANSSCVNETPLLLEVLRKSTSRQGRQLLTGFGEHSVSKPIELSTSRVSKVPTMPYTRRSDESRRQDSIFSTVSSQPPSSVPPALFWYTVFAGALDESETVRAAECLINHIWAEKDAIVFLEEIGNPAKRFSNDDEMEFRRRFGHMSHALHNVVY